MAKMVVVGLPAILTSIFLVVLASGASRDEPCNHGQQNGMDVCDARKFLECKAVATQKSLNKKVSHFQFQCICRDGTIWMQKYEECRALPGSACQASDQKSWTVPKCMDGSSCIPDSDGDFDLYRCQVLTTFRQAATDSLFGHEKVRKKRASISSGAEPGDGVNQEQLQNSSSINDTSSDGTEDRRGWGGGRSRWHWGGGGGYRGSHSSGSYRGRSGTNQLCKSYLTISRAIMFVLTFVTCTIIADI